MNIVLIGYRGTGKSSVGKILAEQLGRELISTDAEVVNLAHLSIPDIVKQSGWDHFRNLESQVCRDLADRDGLIIDTGGGAILRQENVDALKRNGLLFWLTAEVSTITKRIGGDNQRPSLTGSQSFTEEVEEVLRARKPKYAAAADHVIGTEGRSLAEVTEAVLAKLSEAPAG